MDNKNTKEKQVNYMYFPFDYGGIKNGITQFLTAILANTSLLAELSPFYFGLALLANEIVFKLTHYQNLWAWSIIAYIILGALLAVLYLAICYSGKAGVYLYDDSTVVIKTVLDFKRIYRNCVYLRYGKKFTFKAWEITNILMPKYRSYRYRKNKHATYTEIMNIPAYGRYIHLEFQEAFIFTFVLQNNESFYSEILKLKSGADEEEDGDDCDQ